MPDQQAVARFYCHHWQDKKLVRPSGFPFHCTETTDVVYHRYTVTQSSLGGQSHVSRACAFGAQGFPILSFLANRKRFARRGRGAGAGRAATRASTSSPASVASPRESDQTERRMGKPCFGAREELHCLGGIVTICSRHIVTILPRQYLLWHHR